jgi:hypothetical protein
MIRQAVVAATLLSAFTATQAAEVYGAVGLPGVILGFAQPVSGSVTLRADVASLGTHKDTYDEDGIKYDGKLKTNRVGLFADWFPFGNGFRFTGGVTFNDYKLNLHAQGTGNTIDIGGTTYVFTSQDRFDVEVKFPKTTPYLGLGYGHQPESGFGFLFDLGASYGKAKLTETHSGPNLSQASQADIDEELRELRDGVGKVKVIPQLSIGINYRF